MKIKIIALITTSNKRNIQKALLSVKNQVRKPDIIYVSHEEKGIRLPGVKNIYNSFEAGLARNTMSALAKIYQIHGSNVYIATLDDDDEWKSNYLSEVEKFIPNYNFITCWLDVRESNNHVTVYKFGNIKMKDFILGNPGVHGSNKVFHLGKALESGGMLKHLNSSTDRVFNINLLSHPEIKAKVIKQDLVIWNNDQDRFRITLSKTKELDLKNFYNSFSHMISTEEIEKINIRHKKLHSIDKVIKWKK